VTKPSKTSVSLRTADIPQADSLPTIRTVVGDVEAATGRKASALANYRAALKIREQLNAAVPSDVDLRRDLEEAQAKVRSVGG